MMQRRLETQQLWDWRAAAYLFLAGTGAGSTLVAMVYALLFDSYSAVTAVGLLIGPLLAILGSLFLFMDLGRPLLSYLAPRRPGHSWISRGFLILTAFIIVGLIHWALWIWPWRVHRGRKRHMVGLWSIEWNPGLPDSRLHGPPPGGFPYSFLEHPYSAGSVPGELRVHGHSRDRADHGPYPRPEYSPGGGFFPASNGWLHYRSGNHPARTLSLRDESRDRGQDICLHHHQGKARRLVLDRPALESAWSFP